MMNQTKLFIRLFVAISLLLLTSAPLCFADDCPETSASMLFHAQKYIKGYEIADFGSLPEAAQEKIYKTTKSRCPQITQLGHSTYSILFKNKKDNLFIIIIASAYDSIDHPWGFHKVDTFDKMPIMAKIDPSRKYINKISKKEIEVTPTYRSLTVSFLDSNDQYLYTLSKDTRKYIKHEIQQQ